MTWSGTPVSSQRGTREARDRQLARIWHWWELSLVAVLALTSVVGVLWAEKHGQPRFLETHPR